MQRPCALVTGASSGIGAEFARALAARGHDLVLVARTRTALEDLAAEVRSSHLVDADVIAADLCDEAERRGVEARAGSAAEPLDMLVNCAGFGTSGDFVSMPEGEIDGMIALDVAALVRLTRAALPVMVGRNSGTIVNVGSTGSFQPVPHMAVYGAAKAFVHAFTQAVATEVRHTDVRLMSLCPGYTETEFQTTAGVSRQRLPSFVMADPGGVVAACLTDLERGRWLSVPGAANKAGAVAAKLAPARLSARVAGFLIGWALR